MVPLDGGAARKKVYHNASRRFLNVLEEMMLSEKELEPSMFDPESDRVERTAPVTGFEFDERSARVRIDRRME
jgi:hypothetical protein